MFMQSIKSLGRKVRNNLRAARNGMQTLRLNDLTFQSGLGDAAFLLYGLVKAAKPLVVVEIGSARGRSTCFIGKALKENGVGKLYAIDPHTQTAWNDVDSIDTFQILNSNISHLGLNDVVKILRDTSDNVARNWQTEIDLLFIDGDHSYEGARKDWDLFSPFVRPFGSVIFHDTLWDLKSDSQYARPDMGVPRVVEELRVQGYPVLTLDKDFGVSVVQPVRGGVPLRSSSEKTVASAG
jgi:predicted O-methyltransferase YrrM